MCQCGCKGWCTYYPIYEAWRWSLQAGYDNRYPTVRPDLKQFIKGQDDARMKIAGKAIGMVMPLFQIRGDWPTAVDAMGMRSWSHNLHACPVCLCPKNELSELESHTIESSPYDEWTAERHNAETDRCCKAVNLFISEFHK